eukprot:Amastigsp_a8556_4.p4 type:complete len:112 gc:universal Amastigsp_a8556_4:305-640(+)
MERRRIIAISGAHWDCRCALSWNANTAACADVEADLEQRPAALVSAAAREPGCLAVGTLCAPRGRAFALSSRVRSAKPARESATHGARQADRAVALGTSVLLAPRISVTLL